MFKKKSLYLFILLSLILVIVGCSDNNGNNDVAVWNDYQNEDFGFQYPAHWEIVEDKEEYGINIIIIEPKENVNFIFRVEGLYKHDEQRFKGVAKSILEDLYGTPGIDITNGEEAELKEYETIINDYLAYKIEITGDYNLYTEWKKFDEVRGNFTLMNNEQIEKSIWFVYAGLEDKYDSNSEIAKKIINSFKFLNEDIDDKEDDENIALEIEDENLEKALRKEIYKPEGDLYPDDFKYLEELILSRNNISNISPLADINLENLRSLNLWSNDISDINSLADINLENLELLNLRNNDISDISPLADMNLENLESLSLGDNNISDISPLANINLENLESLSLCDNNISDISPLADINLKNLESLSLRKNDISDISSLANMNLENLKSLNLWSSNINDISPLSDINLENLEWLMLSGNNISDISPLINMNSKNLESLRLSGNNISDISPLINMNSKNLKSLRLSSNNISDISPLADMNLENLELLELHYNYLSNSHIEEYRDDIGDGNLDIRY